jgi:hypothetical protein
VNKRQISDAEKAAVLARQGLRCFVDNHPVASADDLEFDHVQAFADGGPSSISNIAGVCKKHNREKGTLLLSQFRDKLELRRFFDIPSKRRLDDLLERKLGKNGYGQLLPLEVIEDTVIVHFNGGGIQIPLQRCPATHERYFFGLVPFAQLRNDPELQPRPLEPDRLWELYLHLQTHTQLAPAVARFDDGRLLLFDGQHKAAAQAWAGRQFLDCKIYLAPELRRLKETNLAAHDKLRQMPFYTSTLLEKYAAMAKEDWDTFLATAGPKSEATFVEFMRSTQHLSRAEATKRIRAKIYQDIIEHSDNSMREYIAEENRSRVNPLSTHRFQKTFLTEFISPTPLNDEFESEADHRDDEKRNVVSLLSTLVTLSLTDKWAPERADAAHKKAARLYSAGALRAWVPMLRDALAPALGLFDAQDRARLFYRDLTPDDSAKVRKLIAKLLSHKVWDDPDPELNDLRYDNPQRAKDMLIRSGLTVGWILGAAE